MDEVVYTNEGTSAVTVYFVVSGIDYLYERDYELEWAIDTPGMQCNPPSSGVDRHFI
jgi:hypothetical protein